MLSVHTSSQSILWETPKRFFDELNARYHFSLDVCATDENAKCKHFFSPEEDGLKQPWQGRCWMNPPYGKEIGIWIEKAYRESEKGALVVALLPARTDTRWFHRFIYLQKGVTSEFIKGRLRFEGAKNAAPFPSMLVVFNRHAYAR
jgi:site-specific DNA-methyltransferase (adenine-specific)